MGQKRLAQLLSIVLMGLSPLLTSHSVLAQDAPPKLGDLRFGAAYLRARSLSPDILTANAGLAVAQSARDEARAAQYPQLGSKLDYDWAHQSVEGDYYGVTELDNSDTFNRYGYSIGLTQGIYRPDLVGASDIATVGIKAAELGLDEAESAIAVKAAAEYFAVVDALEMLRGQLAELRATEEQFLQVENRARSGLAKQSDVATVRAARERASADTIEAENTVEAARLQLQLSIGGDFDRVAVLQAQTPLPRLAPADLETWIKTAIDKRPALSAAQQGVEAARLGVEMTKDRRLPKVDLVGSRVWFDADGGISGAREDTDDRIGLELKLPIFTSGLITADIRRAEAELEKARAEQQAAHIEVKSAVQKAYIAAVSAYRQIDARRRAVEAGQEAERTALVGFEVGTATAADWLVGVRTRYEAERDFARERINYLLSVIQLKAAAGVLGREDMARVELLLKFPEPGWPAPPDLKAASSEPTR